MQAVDSQLLRAMTTAQTLSTAHALERKDFQAFHKKARELIDVTKVSDIIVLSDQHGQQFVNTLRGFGETLPQHGNLELLHRVFETGKPVISDIYIDGVLRQPVMSIDVPVIIGGRITYDLSVALRPSYFNAILNAQGLPQGWVAGIFDTKGTLAGRIPSPEKFVGQKGTEEFIERIKRLPEGSMKTISKEGIPTLSSWSRSTVTGWSVAIGIPREELESGLKRTLYPLAAGILVLLVVGISLAWVVGRRVSDSVHALTVQANALGAGEPATISSVGIIEVAEVATAMSNASHLLQSRSEALQEARQHLEEQVAERTSELVAANQALQQQARKDVLTGIQNRIAADERLHLEFRRMKRTGSSYAVLFIDIDHFKSINDRYGHETGDQVLQRLAQVLQSSVRETDLLARFGGEEFLAVLPDTGAEGAVIIAEKLRLDVADATFPVVGKLTISVGVSVAKADDSNEDVAVRRADESLYKAKREGRNTIRLST